jgi:hypothetical protein
MSRVIALFKALSEMGFIDIRKQDNADKFIPCL